MKKTIFLFATLSLVFALLSTQPRTNLRQSVDLTDYADSLSYAFGFRQGTSTVHGFWGLNKNTLVRGFMDALSGVELLSQDDLDNLFEKSSMAGYPTKPGHIESNDLTDFADSLWYAHGFRLAENMVEGYPDINKNLLGVGFANGVSEFLQLSWDTINSIFNKFHRQIAEQSLLLRDANREIADEFLSENALHSDVVTTESGLQYRIIESGTGKKIEVRDMIIVHYTSHYLDCEGFNASEMRVEFFSFGHENICAGLFEGLSLMCEGDKWQLFLPDRLSTCGVDSKLFSPRGPCLKIEVEVIRVIDWRDFGRMPYIVD
jgi:FKBP-type peptidyl-prolyl cis-trans isomerase